MSEPTEQPSWLPNAILTHTLRELNDIHSALLTAYRNWLTYSLTNLPDTNGGLRGQIYAINSTFATGLSLLPALSLMIHTLRAEVSS